MARGDRNWGTGEYRSLRDEHRDGWHDADPTTDCIDCVRAIFPVGAPVFVWVWAGTTKGGSFDVSDMMPLEVVKVCAKKVRVKDRDGRLYLVWPDDLRKREGW